MRLLINSVPQTLAGVLHCSGAMSGELGPVTWAVPRRHRAHAWWTGAVILTWLAALGLGFSILLKYKSTPGAGAGQAPGHWPGRSRLRPAGDRATLLVFAHPHCPCTDATVSELARLMARFPDRMAGYVVFLQPADVGEDWTRTHLWQRAAAIPGVTAVRDDGGEETERFHAATSGQALLYDREGRLVFSGGITAARGHEGESFGTRRIASLLTTGTADRADSPVFGCSLHHEEGPTAPLERGKEAR